jgi:hypothetical protein
MLSREQIDAVSKEIQGEIARRDGNLLSEFPLEAYLKRLRSLPGSKNYEFLGPSLKRMLDKIRVHHGDRLLALYQKSALCLLIKDSTERLKTPDSIHPLFLDWFERVVNDFSLLPDDYYFYRNDSFLKDLAVCCLRVYPVGGAWLIEVAPAGSKSAIFRQGLSPFMAYMKTLFFEAGGLKPFYSLHTYSRYAPRFTSEEMEKAYLRIAELMKQNPRIKGLYRCSWFLDPALQDLSPNLAYLHRIPMDNGARLFKVASLDFDRRNALAMSPARKRLYEEGKYVPTSYAYIWPRKAFLKWAEKRAEGDGSRY